MEPEDAEAVSTDQSKRIGPEPLTPGAPPEPEADLRPAFRLGPIDQSDLADDLGRTDRQDDEREALPGSLLFEDPIDELPPALAAHTRRQGASDSSVPEDPVECRGVSRTQRTDRDPLPAEDRRQ